MNTYKGTDLLAAFFNLQEELKQFLAFKVSCQDTACDLIQETYLRIAYQTNHGDINNQRAFLFRVANNLALDHLRGRARQEKRTSEPLAEDLRCQQPEPDRVLAGQQQIEQIERLIYKLPPQTRMVFLLCRVEGNSYAEIAAQLGIAPRTVESHMHKAIKFLKQQLDTQS